MIRDFIKSGIISVVIALFIVAMIGCRNAETTEDSHATSDTIHQNDSERNPGENSQHDFIAGILMAYAKSHDFVLDTSFAYIRIGNFLNSNEQHAIVYSFTDKNMTVYKQSKGAWEVVFSQNNIEFCRAYEVKPYIADYNFDGKNDIAINNLITNGAAIRYFHLWLSKGDSFKYIPDFESVGNPVLLTPIKKLHGFSACCVNSEFWLSEYIWDGDSLISTHEIHIMNYPHEMKAVMKNIESNTERNIAVSKAEVDLLDNTYGYAAWSLYAKGGLSRYTRWFEK